MSCNRGIYRVSKRELNELAAGTRHTVLSAVYGTSDGMRSPEANGAHAPAGVKARDGTLWFPTQNGVVRIDPRSLPHSVPPATRIESCLVDRQPVPLDTAVRLNPRNTDLEISYTAMSLTDSNRIRFRYKLDGLDRDWVEAGMRRTAYYSHLPAGRYTFTVIAASSEGVWGTDVSSIALVVLPAFYRTWWFMTACVAGVIGLIALMWSRREARLKRAHLAQQAFSRQLIASEEAERKRIAAELHDSIGQRLVIIKNFAMLAANSATDGVRERLQEISAEASHAITEVREIAQNLRPYHLDRLGLTRALDSLVRKAADASAIEFAADLDPIDGVFQKTDEINVYRVVQESVNNVLKHSHATRASVTVRHSPSYVLLTIRDNGRGFAPSASGDDHPAAGGFGLTGIMERATLLGGRAEIESRPDEGTTITITFDVTEAGRALTQSAAS
jgi:signal transduction histidine kinase